MTTIARLIEGIANREAAWTWDAIDPGLRTAFAERLAALLPNVDPAVEWEAMPLRYRHEIAWHLTRTPVEHRAVWEEDCRRLAEDADEATIQALKVLMGSSLP